MLSATFNSMTRSIREKTEFIEQKNRENEALLLNILPAEIAAGLKGGEHEIADSFADVTVLLDALAQEPKIEKIKTIGDCYMAVCGLP